MIANPQSRQKQSNEPGPPSQGHREGATRPDVDALGEEPWTSREAAGQRRREACLHELFEGQAAAIPDAEALVAGSERVTYGGLNAWANRLARSLRLLGVGRETLVGIFLERSADMVVAIMAVLKAGGAYVPLDPAYPPIRVAFMLNDARVSVVLTQSSLMGALPDLERASAAGPHIICLDTDQGSDPESAENLGPTAEASDLAYVIYTSGSTGQPKGVAIEHRNAVALAQWAGHVYSAHERDGVLAGVSICFDPSILDLLVPLGLGGKVILAPSTLALPGLAAASEVRMIYSVPSVVRELLRIGGIPTSVETINMGGEPLTIQLVKELYALPHVKRVYDLYGPTETTTCSTFTLRTPGGAATIGCPIAGTQVYLLNERFQPVPMGETGELFIGGKGVARGYLNRQEITEEKFISLPVAAAGVARLYRTGDLCRFRPDGNLEFIRRSDEMVKIRGFRVEPGEIESVLLSHPAVRETIVVAYDDGPGQRRLAAYVVPMVLAASENAGSPASAEHGIVPQLRAYLSDRLPDYMMPSAFVLLERFELTPSGKISRFTLPAPLRNRGAAGDYLAPRTPTEELLCKIWVDLLGLGEIGVHDDFFQLGGDSLLGVAMLAEVENKTGLKLRAEAVLQSLSLSRLATIMDEERNRSPPADSPWAEIQPLGNRPRLFLVHGVGGGMLWGYANLARHLGTDQPIYAFKACAEERLKEFDTVEKLAAYYSQALRRFQPEGPYALGGYCFGGNVAHEMACMLDQQGQRISLLALLNSLPPDSSYARPDSTAFHPVKFLRNLCRWMGGFSRWGLARQRQFVLWKLSNLKKRAFRRFRSTPDADELLDLSSVPANQRGLWKSHVQALNGHKTRIYRGKIVLLRTPDHPLNSTFDHECGWGPLAQGGVDVRIISGQHESLMEEPNVGELAVALRVHLDAI